MTKRFLSIAGYLRRFTGRTFMMIAFLITALLSANAADSYAQDILKTPVSIQLNRVTLKTALNQLSKTAKVDLAYNTKALPLEKEVSIKAENKPLDEVLKQLLTPLGLTCHIIGKNILIEERTQAVADTTEPAAIVSSNADRIQGKVLDEEGVALVGVTVKVTSAANSPIFFGSVTNVKGEFTVNANPTDLLQFSYIGYTSKTVAVADLPATGIITMKTSSGSLDEVQIVGYGTTTRRLSTGSQVKVAAKEIEKSPVNNILFALQGRVAGMQIVQGSGSPGAAPVVKIRGSNSIAAGTAPLYILDGIPVPDAQFTLGSQMLNGSISSLLNINPSDLESIEILKDADATAIYGSRGANGVVLITTKKGRAGKTTVTFNGYTGFSRVAHFMDMMDVHQYNAMRREAFQNDGVTATPANAPDLFLWDTTKTHNWQRELIGRNAAVHNAEVAVSGGDANNHYYINAGIRDEGTITPGDGGNTRKSVRFNTDHSSADKRFHIGIIGGYSTNTLKLQQLDLTSFINLAPAYPLYNAAGAPDFTQSRGYPLAYLMQPLNSRTDVYNGQFNMSYLVIKGLTVKLNAAFNNSNTFETIQQPLKSLNPTQNSGGMLQQNMPTNRSWIVEPQIDYAWDRNKHQVDLMAGATWQKNKGVIFNATGYDYTNDALIGNLSSAGRVDVRTGTTEYAYQSVFGRVTYNYDEKYLANLSYRRDGSSRFGPGKRFGNFGSIGLGWIFSKEDFMKGAESVLSYGKIRGSYGINGNDQIADYGYVATYSGSASPGYQGVVLLPSNLANPDYRWEQNQKMDIALELGFINNRILLTADVYRNRTDNQLLYYQVSPQTGFNGYLANFPAKLQNQGIEFEVSSQNIVPGNTRGFSWKTSFNFAKSRNKLLSFPDIESTSYYTTYTVGKSINIIQGYEFTGLNDKGVPVFKDNNGDGSIASADRIVLGANDPLTAGMSNDFSFRNFSFSFLIDYNRSNGFGKAMPGNVPGFLAYNQALAVMQRWMAPGDEAHTIVPRYTRTTQTYLNRNLSASSYNYQGIDIFRLRNVSFAYTLPQQLISRVKMTRAQVYFHAQNLWVSGSKGYVLDPETGNAFTPPLQALTFGINCSF